MAEESEIPEDPVTGEPVVDEESLGDPGKRALKAEREARKTAETRARDLEVELDTFRQASMSDQEKAIETARREARDEALSTVNQRLVTAEVRAVAAGRLHDPVDAIRYIDVDSIAVDNDGNVDAKTIDDQLSALIIERPYLAVGATPRPGFDGGARGAQPPSDMNHLIRRQAGRS